ncbi:MAG TPA: tail fiber domain-containing protein [Candidatus Saccharimonadales bacterium]|nr:tail fiber domain-containing protein [Candidatus Saccharimonadales bacterium]
MFKQKHQNIVTVKRALVLALPVLFVVMAAISALLPSQVATAAGSNTINFQARLLTAAGNVVPDGYYNVEFKLYGALAPDIGQTPITGSCTTTTDAGNTTPVTDEDCIWTETRTGANKVRVANGYLTVNLGSVTSLPSNANWSQELWLSMNIGGTGSPSWDGEMNPRLKLTAVPHAFSSAKVTSSDGTGSATVANGEVGTICIQGSSNCGFIKSQASVLQTATTNLEIQGSDEEATTLVVKAATGQTASIFEVQDATGSSLMAVGPASAAINSSLTVAGGGSAATPSLIVKANASMNNTSTVLEVQQNSGGSAFRVTGGGDVGVGNMTGIQGTVSISSGAYYGKLQTAALSTHRDYFLPNAAGTICLQESASCGFVANGDNSYIKNQQLVAQQAGLWVQGTDASKVSFIFQSPPLSASDIFRVQNADATEIVAVTSNGALSFTGSGTTTMSTPEGSNVQTKIKIAPFDPGEYGQILAFGLTDDAHSASRAISLFDARTGTHQPTIAVFSPNESEVFGLSWDGSNTMAALKTSSAEMVLRTNNGDLATFSNTDIDFARGVNITSTQGGVGGLYVQGAASGTVPVALIKGGATPGSAADLLQVQNANSETLFKVNNNGQLSAARGFDMTYNAGSSFTIQGASSTFVAVDPQNSKFYIGDQANCGGRFCTAQTVATGGSAYTNTVNFMRSTAAVTVNTHLVNQDITIEDDSLVSSGARNNNRGIRIDFTNSDNAYSNYYGLQIKLPTTSSTSSYRGNAIQVEQGIGTTTDIFTVSNTGSVNSRTTADSTSALQVQDSAGNNVFAVDTSGKQIVVGKASTTNGKIVLQNASNANTVTLQSGVVTASYTLTLPTALGATGDCLQDSGSGALAFTKCSLQTAYGSAVGGTTPEIKLDSTRGAFDIQDANTTINGNLLNVRASNASGLGTALFNVGSTGNVGIGVATANRTLDIAVNNSSDTAAPLRLLQTGTGDATIELGTSTRSFIMGVDNSDGSRFKITSTTALGTGFTAGYSSIGTTALDDRNNNNMIVASRATVGAVAGTVNSITIYVANVDAGANHAVAAIYNNATNKPGTLLVSSPSQVLHVGWNTIPITATVAANTTYWVAWQVEGAQTGVSYQEGFGTQMTHYFSPAEGHTGYGTWPNLSATTSPVQYEAAYSAYISGTGASAGGNSFNVSLMNLGDSGVTFKTVSDSGDAFRVVNSQDNTLFSVDTLQSAFNVSAITTNISSATTNISGTTANISNVTTNLSGTTANLNSTTTNINSANVFMAGIAQSTAATGIRGLCMNLNAGANLKRVTYAAAATTCYSSSARFKHNIATMSDGMGLDTLMGLRPVTYVYNEGEQRTMVGLIAEEVAEVLPEVVEYDEQGRPTAINYEFMVANLIKGIQQQQLQINDLQQGLWNGGIVANDTTFNGYVAFNSDVTFMSDAEFNGKSTFNGSVAFNENTTGSVILPEGETEVEVVFTQPYATVPNISVSSSDFTSLKVQDKTVNGFKVVVQHSLAHDITIDWIALQARELPPPPNP